MCGTVSGTMCGTTDGATSGTASGVARTSNRGKVWLIALLQIALSTAFMVVFKFPRIMIAIFAGVILLATAFSAHLRARPVNPRTVSPSRPVAHPVLFRTLSLGIAVGMFALVCILLFGFVMFINSWNRWHQFEGQPHHAAEFQVHRVYYQKNSKGGPSLYASGTVEGNREWMSLYSYLGSTPHGQSELEARVPSGTSIPIYLYTGLKGRSRVQLNDGADLAEANHQAALATLNHAVRYLALDAAILFVLILLRRGCYGEDRSGNLTSPDADVPISNAPAGISKNVFTQ